MSKVDPTRVMLAVSCLIARCERRISHKRGWSRQFNQRNIGFDCEIPPSGRDDTSRVFNIQAPKFKNGAPAY